VSEPDGGAVGSRSLPVLYAVVCGSPAAGYVGELVGLAQREGWQVCVVATPDGRKFIDVATLAQQTGHPVRSEFKNPGDLDVLPAADAIVVAPATVNTVNKWACGIADTLALGMLIEGYGLGVPIAVMPYTNTAMAAHPAFRQSLRRLRTWGVRVLFGDDVVRLPPPGTAAAAGRAGAFPWELVLAAVGPPRSARPLGTMGRRGFVSRSLRSPARARVSPAPPKAPRPAPAILRTP
jgi:flavoprotein